MISIKSPGTFTSAGFLSAFAASLCCTTPVIALLAGSSSIAVNFSWIEPARPYLLSVSITVLAFAWYLKLSPVKKNITDCICETTQKVPFLQSKAFLGIATVLAILMMSFPLYAKIFYPKPPIQASAITKVDNKKNIVFTIQGMTCAGCEEQINSELAKVKGVLAYKTSYASKYSLVAFDSSKVDVKAIKAAINNTGYKVKECKTITP